MKAVVKAGYTCELWVYQDEKHLEFKKSYKMVDNKLKIEKWIEIQKYKVFYAYKKHKKFKSKYKVIMENTNIYNIVGLEGTLNNNYRQMYKDPHVYTPCNNYYYNNYYNY
jgi:hypothetical protein